MYSRDYGRLMEGYLNHSQEVMYGGYPTEIIVISKENEGVTRLKGKTIAFQAEEIHAKA